MFKVHSKTIMLLGLFGLLVLSGCQQKATEEIDFGTIDNSVYHNKYFGMSVQLPPEWTVLDQKQRDDLSKLGGKLIAGDDASKESALNNAATLQTVNMFAVYEHPLGTTVEYNPSVTAIAERVRQAPEIKQGKDYLFHSKKLLSESALQVNFPKPMYAEQIGGQSFDVLPIEITASGVTIQQKMYATINKGYALLLVASFTNEAEEAKVTDILKTATFTQ